MNTADDASNIPKEAAAEPRASLMRGLLPGLHSRHPARTVVDLEDRLGGALDDAEVLLAFAAQSRHAMKREGIEALNNAMAALRARRQQRQQPTADELSAFWMAYDALGTSMAPLSALSIRSSMQLNAKRFPASLFTATGINALFAFVVFFACILLQGFWGAGRELLDKAEALDAHKAELELSMQRNEGVLTRRQSQVEELNQKLCPPFGLCPEDGYPEEPAAPVAKNAPGAKPQLGKDEEAKLRAEKQVAQAESREKEIVLQELYSELQTLNERSHAVEGVIRSWNDQTSSWCESVMLKILCPIRQRTVDEEKRAEERQAKSDQAKRLNAARARLADLKAEQKAKPKPDAMRDSAYGTRDLQLPVEYRLSSAERAVEVAEADVLRATLLNVRLTLANIANYLIPMLMGLLGALAFILRSLTIQLREHTYVHMSASLSVVRMCLGAVAGVFGTMLAPGTEGALKGLPPLIVPFVFGYGIEILFSIMDRVVGSFTQQDGQKSADRAPA